MREPFLHEDVGNCRRMLVFALTQGCSRTPVPLWHLWEVAREQIVGFNLMTVRVEENHQDTQWGCLKKASWLVALTLPFSALG